MNAEQAQFIKNRQGQMQVQEQEQGQRRSNFTGHYNNARYQEPGGPMEGYSLPSASPEVLKPRSSSGRRKSMLKVLKSLINSADGASARGSEAKSAPIDRSEPTQPYANKPVKPEKPVSTFNYDV
jgi:hypothetical protein